MKRLCCHYFAKLLNCLSRLVEQNSNAQEVVCKMPQLIDKLLHMIYCACRGCQSASPGHSLFSSQLAAITLFYCTFNVKSAQSLVDCGALAKMIEITTNLLVDEVDHDTPLRWELCEISDLDHFLLINKCVPLQISIINPKEGFLA